jgi:hypothetical protein
MTSCSICSKSGVIGQNMVGLYHNTASRIEKLAFCYPLFSCIPERSSLNDVTIPSLGCVECGSILKIVESINEESVVGLYALLCERCRLAFSKFALEGCHYCGGSGKSNRSGGGLRVCPGCNYARYCSEKCQRKDWRKGRPNNLNTPAGIKHKNVCSGPHDRAIKKPEKEPEPTLKP